MYIRKAPELYELAHELINDESKHLGHLFAAPIYFYLVSGLKGKASLEYGKVEKIGGLLQLYASGRISEYDEREPGEAFGIQVNGLLWELVKEERTKEQILYNLLLRCGQDENGKLEIARPDIQAFTEEVNAYGPDLPSVKKLLGILTNMGQEHLDFDGAAGGEQCPPELRLIEAGPPRQIEAYQEPTEAPVEADFVVIGGSEPAETAEEAPRSRARRLKAAVAVGVGEAEGVAA